MVLAPYGTGIDPALVPANAQRAVAEQLQRSQSLDLTDFLNRQFSSVSINHAQNNPLQPDFNFRGFTASPLLGLPQGLPCTRMACASMTPSAIRSIGI